MGKVILYVAQSLDGYIARENGAVDWLSFIEGEDYGFHKFFDEVSVVFLGNTTYNQVLTFEGEFPYKSKDVFVFTRDNSKYKDENVQFIASKVGEYTKKIKNKAKGPCWLVGGGQITSYFLENHLLDEIRLFTIPILLGSGIPLFNKINNESKVKLIKNTEFKTGVIESVYQIIE
ncbi:MAG: dihydrofolate reductase family protein [Bacteroidales bacterium]|nr:dihydrofolate reductase family protein [Bacteroidales bacterium]